MAALKNPFISRSLSLVPIRTDKGLSQPSTLSRFHHPGSQHRPTQATGRARGCRIPPPRGRRSAPAFLRAGFGWCFFFYPPPPPRLGSAGPSFSFFPLRRWKGLAGCRRRAGGWRAGGGSRRRRRLPGERRPHGPGQRGGGAAASRPGGQAGGEGGCRRRRCLSKVSTSARLTFRSSRGFRRPWQLGQSHPSL